MGAFPSLWRGLNYYLFEQCPSSLISVTNFNINRDFKSGLILNHDLQSNLTLALFYISIYMYVYTRSNLGPRSLLSPCSRRVAICAISSTSLARFVPRWLPNAKVESFLMRTVSSLTRTLRCRSKLQVGCSGDALFPSEPLAGIGFDGQNIHVQTSRNRSRGVCTKCGVLAGSPSSGCLRPSWRQPQARVWRTPTRERLCSGQILL